MKPGLWGFINLVYCGENAWGKPIVVVTVSKNGGPEIKFYATPLLFTELVNKPETLWIKYEGVVQSRSGHYYPRFKCIE